MTLPNVAHHAILDALEQQNPGALWYDATFTCLRFDGSRVIGLQATRHGESVDISARLVVGADGAFSKVRESLGITANSIGIPQSYLIAILKAPPGFDEARYLVGKREILGLFPAAGQQVYAFYMIKAGSYEAVKAQGLEALRRAWVRIDPGMEGMVQELVDWSQTGYMPTGRVKTDRWVADGALLIGDAAHAMNPHASQGRMQAMVDAVAVADLIPGWLKNNDFLC